MKTSKTPTSAFAFHQGEALIKIAAMYASLLEVIFECVQNALDANASKIWITLNRHSRTLTVSDNGDGRTKIQFETALTSVCSSVKADGKLGQFGIGLISPLGKCERFTFTSTPKNNAKGYLEWEFVTKNLQRQQVVKGIPMKERPELAFNQATTGGGQTPWRTRVAIEQFSADRLISKVTFEALRDGLLERYGPTMRRLRTEVVVHITEADGGQKTTKTLQAEGFSGQELPQVKIVEGKGHEAMFRLYLARRTDKGRRGKVFMGRVGDEYRLSFASFAKAVGTLVNEDVAKALASGFFEGDILTSVAELHPNRRGFVQNDNLILFCEAIENWFRDHGKNLYKEAAESRRDERYQELGRRCLLVLEDLLKNPAWVELVKVIEGFKRGTVGAGHTAPDDAAVVGVQDEPSLALDGNRPSSGPTPEPEDDEKGKKPPSGKPPRKDPEEDKEAHSPSTIKGPKGRRRIVVKSDSLGLQLSPEAMEGCEKAWELDTQNGILRLNTRHPAWVTCEDDDASLMRYIEFIVVQALVFNTLPEEWQQQSVVQTALAELLGPYSHVLRHGDEVARRKVIGVKKPVTTPKDKGK